MLQTTKKSKIPKLSLFIFFFFLLITGVFALTGTCNLDQEQYGLGETASFLCSCTGSQEQNRAGYFVWKNETGGILKSIATNSLTCTTDFFGDSYIFSEDYEFIGNVTFSLNADGTGTPLFWGDVGDKTTDIFNYTTTSPYSCLITNISVPSEVKLGTNNYNYFKVTDASTSHNLIGAVCRAVIFSADGSPLLIEPYADDFSKYRTGEGGFMGFKSDFSNNLFEPDRIYSYTIECGCINETGYKCFDQTTRENAGFKSCSVTALFTTGEEDFREQDSLIFIGLVISSISLILIFSLLGYFNKKFFIKFVAYMMAGIQIIILLGIGYGFVQGINLEYLIKVNFYSGFIIGFMLMIISSLFFSIETSSLSTNDKYEDEKWENKKWNKEWEK